MNVNKAASGYITFSCFVSLPIGQNSAPPVAWKLVARRDDVVCVCLYRLFNIDESTNSGRILPVARTFERTATLLRLLLLNADAF